MATTKKVTVDAAEKKMAVKAEAPAVVKKETEKAAEVKAETKAESVKNAAPVAPIAAPAEEKKAKKPAAKKLSAPKKDAAPKKEAVVKSEMIVQFDGKEFTEKGLLAAVKKAYTKLGNKTSDIKKIEIYVKPEESAAYYVVNGVGSDEYRIDL